MSRFPKPCFLLLLPMLAPLSHAELIASYDSNNYRSGNPLFAVDWSDSVEQPSDFWVAPTVTATSSGFMRFAGWGTSLDLAKYASFKVSSKTGYKITLTGLKNVNTASNRISGTEVASFVWAYRVDDDKDGIFERDWVFGRVYTAADGDAFTTPTSKDWVLPAGVTTKGTVEFGLFATAVAPDRALEPFSNSSFRLEGSSVPIGPLGEYQYVASYAIALPEASAVAYNWDTDTLFSIGDEGNELVEFSKTGQRISAMPFDQSGNSSERAMQDPEGLNYLGGGKFIVGEERKAAAVFVTYDPATRPSLEDLRPVSYSFGIGAGNQGLEGIAYDPIKDSVWGVREIGPAEIREIPHITAVRTGQPHSVRFPIDRNRITRICNQLSDIYIMAQCSYFPAGHPRRENILLLSRGAKEVLEITRSGKLVGVLSLSFLHRETVEGITMDNNGNIYLVSENVIGNNFSDLHVFSPGSDRPQAATPQQTFAMETLRGSFETLGLDPALVFGSQEMVAAVENARQKGRTDVIASPENYELFTETSIQDLRGTGVLIRVEGDEVNLSLPIQTSEEIADALWEDAGVEMKATLPKTANKAFYRLTLPQN